MIQVVHEPAELATLLDANAPADQFAAPSYIYQQPGEPFCPVLWILDPDNLALRIGLDLAMFEDKGQGEWVGHIWFNCRGALALERARALLGHMFDHYGARVIRGEVPEWRKDVLLFVRKLGFKRVGEARHPLGRLVVLTLQSANHPARPAML